MSLPNLTNNIIQPQNIVINQGQLTHTIMTNVNANNGIPMATAMGNASSVMDQGDVMPMAGGSLVQQGPPQPSPAKVLHTTSNAVSGMGSSQQLGGGQSESSQVLSKTRMSDLVRDIDPNIYIDDDVEEILLGYVDDFVDRVLNGASLIAKHRHNQNIEVKDVQQFINRNFNMWAPGFGTDELRPFKRSLTTESHKQRLALIRKAVKKY